MRNRPIVYIASPYTKGDPCINTHFQMQIFNLLMNEGRVWPVIPLVTHFMHTAFPRPYKDWIEYDHALIPKYDICLRLNAEFILPNGVQYKSTESSGADGEVALFQKLGKPVFYTIEHLYKWLDKKEEEWRAEQKAGEELRF